MALVELQCPAVERKSGQAAGHVEIPVQRNDGMAVTGAMQLDQLRETHLRSPDGKGREDMEQML